MVRRDEEERRYHHGNLRQALVAAGVGLARSGGPNAVVLRAVTREANVSHNAAYRHFASQEDLLAAVAEECMTKLAVLMNERAAAVTARGPVRRAQARLEAIGRAYIEFARTETGWFRTAFSSARPHRVKSGAAPTLGNEPDGDQTTSPFAILGERLDDLVAAGAMPRRRRGGAEFAAWSAVHGLSSLLVDGPLRDLPEPQVEHAVTIVLASVARGLQ